MDEAPRMNEVPQRSKSRSAYVSIAMMTGAACAIVALVNGPGVIYAVVGVLAGLSYGLVGVYDRRHSQL